MAATDLHARPHRNQPLFRDGLGLGLARHRRRPAHGRRARSLGTRRILAVVLRGRPPACRQAMGTDRWAASGGHLVRMLGREYSAGCSALERRATLWWGES